MFIIIDVNGCVKEVIEIEVLCLFDDVVMINVGCLGDGNGSLVFILFGIVFY